MNTERNENVPHDPPSVPDLTLLRPIGRGSFGDVWLACNKHTGRPTAVKVVPFTTANEPARAERELAALSRLFQRVPRANDHLVHIDHVGRTHDGSYLYYLMPLADDAHGGPPSLADTYEPATLAQRLRSNREIPLDQCARWARELVSALAFLHGENLTHRDVKPANCLFIQGHLKLTDFGLVTLSDQTATTCLGTPVYMRSDATNDASADVYAAGLVIYEMLTRMPPQAFPRWSAHALCHRANPLACRLSRVVLRACARDRSAAYRDAAEMLAAIDERPTFRFLSRTRVAVAVSILAGSLSIAGFFSIGSAAATVSVNFVTRPFEAQIILDGKLLRDAHGTAYTTPCTVDGVRTGHHSIRFRYPGLSELDVGDILISADCDVQARWP